LEDAPEAQKEGRRMPEARSKDGGGGSAHRVTDQQLLDAAREVFAELGFHEASMDAIAARAGSTKPTLYAHFGSKEDLHHATVEREVNVVAGQLLRAYETAAEAPLNEALRVSMAAFFEFACSNPGGFHLVFGNDIGAPAEQARDWLKDAMGRRVTDVVRGFGTEHGLNLGRSAEMISEMLLGLAFHGASAALENGLDEELGTELATTFADAAIRNLDRDVLAQVDAASLDGDGAADG
jgi:AcrR family transcriptional regulator